MNKIKKEVSVVARCTKKEKEAIQHMAKKQGKSETKYILDCCMAGTERKTDKMKKLLIKKIHIQEYINQIRFVLNEYSDQIPKEVRDALEIKVNELEEGSICLF